MSLNLHQQQESHFRCEIAEMAKHIATIADDGTQQLLPTVFEHIA